MKKNTVIFIHTTTILLILMTFIHKITNFLMKQNMHYTFYFMFICFSWFTQMI